MSDEFIGPMGNIVKPMETRVFDTIRPLAGDVATVAKALERAELEQTLKQSRRIFNTSIDMQFTPDADGNPPVKLPSDPIRDEMIAGGYLVDVSYGGGVKRSCVDLARMAELRERLGYLEICKLSGAIESMPEFTAAESLIDVMATGKAIVCDSFWADSMLRQLQDCAKQRGYALDAEEDTPGLGGILRLFLTLNGMRLAELVEKAEIDVENAEIVK